MGLMMAAVKYKIQAKPVWSQASPLALESAVYKLHEAKETNSTGDRCSFVCQHNDKKLIVAIYVDGGLMAGCDEIDMDVFLDQFSHNVKIRTGTHSSLLGM